MSAPILVDAEMDEFAEAYLAAEEKAAGSQAKWEKLHAELYRLLSPAVARFAALLESEDEDDAETAEDFRADLNDYVRKYGFLAQIVPYRDAELERLHLYGRYLLNRLPRRADGGVDIGEIDLSHLRVEKTGEHDVSPVPRGPAQLPGFGDGSGGAEGAGEVAAVGADRDVQRQVRHGLHRAGRPQAVRRGQGRPQGTGGGRRQRRGQLRQGLRPGLRGQHGRPHRDDRRHRAPVLRPRQELPVQPGPQRRRAAWRMIRREENVDE